MNKTPGKPFMLFGIDVSKGAIVCGAASAAIEAVKAACSCLTDQYAGVAVMLFDRHCTFYTPWGASVMTDISDPFLPVHSDRLFMSPEVLMSAQGAGVLSQVASLITAAASATTGEQASPLCAFGAAVTCATAAVKERGGRCLLFLSSLPSGGLGALKNRSMDGQAPVTDKASPLLHAQGDFYARAGREAAEAGVSLNLCLLPAGYLDCATLAGLSEASSGRVFYHSGWAVTQPAARVASEISGWFNSPFAFDCLARVRTGSGLQVKKHYGAFSLASNANDLCFGSLDSDQSFGVGLEYDGKLSERERICFQVACLYTHPSTGQRRIRVLNLALPVSAQMATLFRFTELDTILAFLVKKNATQILEAPLAAFPASLTAKAVSMLAAYRKYCAANMSAGQLILPDSLKLLPVLTLAACKDPAFSPLPLNFDVRAVAVQRLRSVGINHLLESFYPRLYPVSTGEGESEILPACLRLSREHLSRSGQYLLCSGRELVLFVGDGSESTILQELFGHQNLNACALPANGHLPVLQNARSGRLRQMITALRGLHAPVHLPLRVVRQSVDVAEEAELMTAWMVEDASPAGASYVDYLCRVHGQIQQAMTQGATLSLAERTSMMNFFH